MLKILVIFEYIELITIKKYAIISIHNYRFIVGFNAGLIGAGVLGFIQPTTSAVLHNTSTLCIGLRSMKIGYLIKNYSKNQEG